MTGPSLSALLPGTSPDTTAVAGPSDGPDEADSVEALEDVPSGAPEDAGMPTDSLSEREARLLRRYVQARVARDSAVLDTLTKPAQMIVAGPRIEALTARSEAFEDRNDELEEKVEELRAQVQSPSLWRMGRAMINDLDFTLGWVGLYFTLFLALWNGRTPGKYLLGIRVVRLNGEPLRLWFAFERFGGYAAGIATGLLGFAQLYWDPNRQAIHDRVARTVVISTRSS
ncbi:MAG: RDD family protein [Salinibacter sp.]|uniref:RDD family protein n=1 Tax=Salinibacter sp. TaxID=2065818 RepID=UPI0035D50D14